tara:strand:- start:203 stop:2173 length:1971 start_codon:yes stop_codon:yes gene_type:complete
MVFRSLIKFILILQFYLFPNITSNHGIEGVINTPSAYINDEGELKLLLYRGQPDRKFVISANPFDWMQASLFYVDVTNRIYGGNFKQSYKDKGFNLKINLLKESNFPAFSIGFNDFAGTGLYNSEYIVLSKSNEKISYSLGIGWGDFSSGLVIRNPLISINDSFKNREILLKDLGGTPNPSVFFRGDASIFGNLVFRQNSKLSYLLELDPTVTTKYETIPYTPRKSKYSIGSYYKFNDNLHIKASFERGTEATFSLIFNESYKKFRSDPRYKKNDQLDVTTSRYKNLQKILELNAIGLNSVSENSDTIRLNIKQNSYNNISISNKNIWQSLKDSGLNYEGKNVEIIQTFLGMEVHNSVIDGSTSPVFQGNAIKLQKSELEKKYIVKEKFPIINSTNSLDPKFFFASREGFLHGGLFLNNNTEIILKENLIITSNLRHSLFDNFDELYIPPVDTYPVMVRSDIKKYLNKLNDGITIGRLQLDYFLEQNKNYFQLSIGLLEDMFAGAIIDYLYFPQDSILGAGVEISLAKKRDYDGRFGLQDYENSYSRFKAVIREPKNKIITTLSYGEYIAGDIGYTLEMNKRFKNGVKFGVFFSKTDVPANLFGEGSFDKGITMSIPFGFGRKSINNLEWRPLTKDPASLIIRNTNLIDLIERYRN